MVAALGIMLRNILRQGLAGARVARLIKRPSLETLWGTLARIPQDQVSIF